MVEKFDHEFPERYFNEFVKYISITEEKFWETINKFRSPHLWKKVSGVWKLRHNVAMNGVDD